MPQSLINDFLKSMYMRKGSDLHVVAGDPPRMRVHGDLITLDNQRLDPEELKAELLGTVRKEMGPVAVIGELNVVTMLPKTRSGKIMRRVLRAVTLGKDPGDVTTLEDEGSVEEARQAFREMRESLDGGNAIS